MLGQVNSVNFNLAQVRLCHGRLWMVSSV